MLPIVFVDEGAAAVEADPIERDRGGDRRRARAVEMTEISVALMVMSPADVRVDPLLSA